MVPAAEKRRGKAHKHHTHTSQQKEMKRGTQIKLPSKAVRGHKRESKKFEKQGGKEAHRRYKHQKRPCS